MKLNFTLGPRESYRQQLDGKYLIITKASAPLDVSLGNAIAVEVDLNDKVEMRDEVQEKNATFYNTSDGNNVIEIITSDLQVFKNPRLIWLRLSSALRLNNGWALILMSTWWMPTYSMSIYRYKLTPKTTASMPIL